MTALPPLATGADHDNVAWPFPCVATNVCGTVGIVAGVALTGALAVPAPTAFTPLTRNRYVVPFVRPVTVAAGTALPVLAIATVHVTPLSVDCSIL